MEIEVALIIDIIQIFLLLWEIIILKIIKCNYIEHILAD